MALLTDEQLHAIREIIRRHHQAFVVNVISPGAVPPEVLEELQRAGLIDPSATSIEDAYKLGQVLAAGTNPAVANMSLADFRRWLVANPVPLTTQERRAVEIAQHRAAQYAVGLGNRIDTSVGERIVQADRALAQQIRDTIKTKTAENIARRQTVKELASDLKWATKDWGRDWDRIAVTEKHNATQQGLADGYAKRHGPDVLVAKRPMPDACKHCQRLHLGADGQPKIFKLSTLEANGSNYGRKAKEWQPVVGATHPNCQCQLVRIPEGWGFDSDGSLVPGGELGEYYESNDALKRAMEAEGALRKAALAGHINYQGIPVAVETAKGQTRYWTDEHGRQGETKMLAHYGYAKRTAGADGEEIDVYVGDHAVAPMAYVIHQIDPTTGRYDEDKVFLGYLTAAAARAAFRAHRDDEGALGDMVAMDIEQLKRWLSGSAPRPGHDPTRERFVIPLPKPDTLRKAVERRTQGGLQSTGSVATEIGAQASPAGNRNPGEGTMVNFMEGNVGRHPVRMHPALEGFDPNATSLGDVERRRVYVDADDYQLTIGGVARQPLKVWPIPHDISEVLYVSDSKADREAAAATKAWLEHQDVTNRQRPRNNVDVTRE